MIKRVVLLVLGFGVSACCVFWLASKFGLSEVRRELARIGWMPWFGAAILYLLGFVPRALRWKVMLNPIQSFPLPTLWRSIMVGYAGNNVLPFRMGEVLRAVAFRRMTAVPASTGLASVISERLLDGATIVVVLVVAGMGIGARMLNATSLRPVYLAAALLVGAAAGVLLLVGWCGESSARRVGMRFPKLGARLASVSSALHFVRTPRLFVAVLLLSWMVWLVEGAMFVLVAHSLGIKSPWLTGYLALAVVNLGILIPAAPGYVGVFQMASVLAFSVLGLPQESGLAFGILVHSAQFVPVTLLGLALAIPLWGDLSLWRSEAKERV